MQNKGKIALISVLSVLFTVSCASAELNKSAFKKNIASRVENAIKKTKPDAQIDIKPRHIELNRVVPTSVKLDNHQMDLYAVRASLQAPGRNRQSSIKMIVDQSGELEFTIKQVTSGGSLMQSAKDQINKVTIPSELGQSIYSQGSGHELVLVSDPFCPYCKKALDFFLEHKDKISDFRIVHLPYKHKKGSSVASWAMMDGAGKVDPVKLVQFAYSELDPVKADSAAERNKNIIKQFIQKFPKLKDKWGDAEQARYYLKGKYEQKLQTEARKAKSKLGVQATPGVFIDGVPVKGWAPKRYAQLLGVSEHKKLSKKEE